MNMTNQLIYPIALAMTLWTAPALAQQRPALPIAYISIQKILSESESAKAATTELETLRKTRAQELTAKKQAFDETKLQIANAGGIFSGAKRQQLIEQARRQESELQTATQQAQVEFAEHQRTNQERLRNQLTAIVRTLATERGVFYVLNEDAAVIMAPAAANWTNDVLERLNSTSTQKPADTSPRDKAPGGKTAPTKP